MIDANTKDPAFLVDAHIKDSIIGSLEASENVLRLSNLANPCGISRMKDLPLHRFRDGRTASRADPLASHHHQFNHFSFRQEKEKSNGRSVHSRE
jgi:hypothetical protein